MARKKKPEEHVSHERWLVSYADFITLLFAFFTTMYAISNVDAQKMGKMVMSMRASFDNAFFAAGSPTLSLSPGQSTQGNNPITYNLVQNIRVPKEAALRDSSIQKIRELKPGYTNKKSIIAGDKGMGRLQKTIESLVGAEALKGKVRTRIEGRGLVISLGEGGFFPSGSDQITREGLALLDTIATGLSPVGNMIRVEGHTDNVPIKNSKFPSNWELSTARSTTIVAYLLAKFGFSPESLSAAGYGEYHPIATNDTDEGKACNRRVDLVVLNPSAALLEPR
jgi:chemotaxis protein MotB